MCMPSFTTFTEMQWRSLLEEISGVLFLNLEQVFLSLSNNDCCGAVCFIVKPCKNTLGMVWSLPQANAPGSFLLWENHIIERQLQPIIQIFWLAQKVSYRA